MRWAGAPDAIIRRRIEQKSFVVFHENWRAWCLFLQCATQWRRETVFASHMKKPVLVTHGLNYAAVEAMFRMCGIGPLRQKKLFRKIRWIEAGSLKGFSERVR